MDVVNSYAALPERFFERAAPAPVRAPRLLLWNDALATTLELAPELADPDLRAQVFGGNHPFPEGIALALAYAGHQFGHFVPSLGDGRAHLLAELVDRHGQRQDVQLKGSGPTAFSRGGDGRCGLGPAIREFIMSEAMHGLGVRTTRSLAVVATGELVMRNPPQPGAVVTRVASSHLRVGTFQYFAARHDHAAVETLVEYALRRHDPELELEGMSPRDRALALLDGVIDRQLATVTDWMRIGFIHGVMNTDNTTISGQTIDFGPCAMMSAYDPKTVFSSIDRQGRYAYGNQPQILAWNMTRLAECLLPLVDPDEEAAIEVVRGRLEALPGRLESAWMEMMGLKLGLDDFGLDDIPLLGNLLDRMREQELDYTLTFDRLADLADDRAAHPDLAQALGPWQDRWRARLGDDRAPAVATMRRVNPVIIPRNHHVEAAIEAAVERDDLEPTHALLAALATPYDRTPTTAAYADAPRDNDRDYQTFCGT